MQVVILAGGLGTRMRPETEAVPKALIEVAGRPFAWWQLDLLASQGAREVVFAVGHLGEQVRESVGGGGRWGIEVRYSHDGPERLGTGGALRLAADRGLLAERFFVLYGDSYLRIDLADVDRCLGASGLPAVMTLFPAAGLHERANASYADGMVTLYRKGSPPEAGMGHVDHGLSLLRREVVTGCIPPATVADLARTFNELSLAGRLGGYVASQRFYEIGSRAGLAELEEHLLSPAGP